MNRIRKTKGFTLVEIMIVVLIIGILMAIAVPNFVRARENSRKNTCIANLKQIESGKEQYMMDNSTTTAPTLAELAPAGGAGFLKKAPVCPSGGTYTVGAANVQPSCSTTGHTL